MEEFSGIALRASYYKNDILSVIACYAIGDLAYTRTAHRYPLRNEYSGCASDASQVLVAESQMICVPLDQTSRYPDSDSCSSSFWASRSSALCSCG